MYTENFLSLTNCQSCAENFWGPFLNYDVNGNQYHFCYACADNSVASVGSNSNPLDCLCNPGYTADSNERWYQSSYYGRGFMDTRQCKLCEEGKYKSTVGTGPCSDCAQGTVPSADKTMCICDSTHILNTDGECEACPSNSHAVNNQCECNTGYYVLNSACKKCQTENAVDCVCERGYFLNEETNLCQACEFGKFKNETGNHICSECAYPRHNQQLGLTSCADCSPVEDFCTGKFKLFRIGANISDVFIGQSPVVQNCSILEWKSVRVPGVLFPAQICIQKSQKQLGSGSNNK